MISESSFVYRASERRSKWYRQIAADAARLSWTYDEAMRAVRHAKTQAEHDAALENLMNLNDLYPSPLRSADNSQH